MKNMTITSPNFNLDEALENMALYDYYEDAVLQKATPESVFELFNGTVTAIEAESNARTVLVEIHNGDISFKEIRVRELVKSYDDFINAPDFELDVFAVHKFEMENFWHNIYGKNAKTAPNKGTTYGKSSIWEIKNGKVTVGFLNNNMTYDGQNSYCLTSVKFKKTVESFFRVDKQYPPVVYKNGTPANRWTRILDVLAVNHAKTYNAWSVLETEDSKYFYGELKKHMGVDKVTRQQMASIASKSGGNSFDIIKEEAEELLEEMELILSLSDEIDKAEDELEEMEYNGASVDELAIIEDVISLMKHWLSFYGDITTIEIESEEMASWLCSVDEEHNSDSPVSTIEDYDNFNYYADNYYNEWRFIGNGE